MAVQNGHDATVRLLLDRGANLEATANGGWTALHLAADMGHEAVIRLLLDHGAHLEATNNNGWTALQVATYQGNEATIRLLQRSDRPRSATPQSRILTPGVFSKR